MWILTVLLLIFILGIIILVHELGHFFWAKKFGVHIYEFSIGMGKVLFTHKGKDGILYNRNDNKEAQFERTVGSY